MNSTRKEMNWILLTWTALATPTIQTMATFEECKARAEMHVRGLPRDLPKAFCLRLDGGAVVEIEPPKKR